MLLAVLNQVPSCDNNYEHTQLAGKVLCGWFGRCEVLETRSGRYLLTSDLWWSQEPNKQALNKVEFVEDSLFVPAVRQYLHSQEEFCESSLCQR